MKNYTLFNGRQIAFYSDRLEAGAIPLVLVHGFCEDSGAWDTMMPALEPLPLLRIDLPGFGNSDLPVASGIDQYADAVCAVLNELNISRAVLVGHSLGGYVALEFAAKFAERLAGFGLFHSHAYADTPERIENRRRGIDMLKSGKKDLYVAQLFPGLFAPAFAAAHPETVETFIRHGRQQPVAGIINALESMIDRADHRDTLRNSKCPVLLLAGGHDALIPSDWVVEMAHLSQICDVRILPDAGHMGMAEAPQQCAAALTGFYSLCSLV